ADLAAFIPLASKLASTPAALAPAPVPAAAAASLTRITLARRAARRCLTARAALSRARHREPWWSGPCRWFYPRRDGRRHGPRRRLRRGRRLVRGDMPAHRVPRQPPVRPGL